MEALRNHPKVWNDLAEGQPKNFEYIRDSHVNEVGTAVQPNPDQAHNSKFGIQRQSPHANDTFEKFDGCHTPIYDEVTVSSKKVSSSSPQSKRSPNGESPAPTHVSRKAIKCSVPQFKASHANLDKNNCK